MIYSVQYLRGIAALMVVLHHIEIKGGQYGNGALNGYHIGYFGVDLFFIISGFIMCHTTSNKDISFRKFMGARIFRILPLYWLITTVALAVFLIAPGMVNSGGGTTSIWASYFLAPNGARYLVDNGWTLRYEFFFYLIFGASLLIKTNQRGLLITAIISTLTLAGFVMKPDNPWGEFFLDKLLLEFVMGIFAFHVLKRSPPSPALALLLLIGGIVALVVQNIYGNYETPLHRVISGGVPMLCIFIGLVRFEEMFRQSNNLFFKAFERLGDSSFSLYLAHPFVLSPAAIILYKINLGNYTTLFTLLLLSSAIITGWLCYKFVELPLTRFIKQKNFSRENKIA